MGFSFGPTTTKINKNKSKLINCSGKHTETYNTKWKYNDAAIHYEDEDR